MEQHPPYELIMADHAVHIADSPGRGVLIGILSALGSALLAIALLALILFLKYTTNGRILLDRIGRPGEYDDEQAFLQEEERALETMDDLQRHEYLRAKAFVQANPPESMQTDISLSQFLAIQEKGVAAWEFEPELEIANCFVEGRTEIEFFDMECCVQSNLPMPKQNEVYYWEAKIFDKPENTTISVGVTTKPYPLFRLPGAYTMPVTTPRQGTNTAHPSSPGYHKQSIAYLSTGQRRYNQPFTATRYGHSYFQGDVVGVGYRPRSGTLFFTHNGKRFEDVAHGLKTQNFFPTIGATGPCSVHVNFGQMGFVFIEANVKKWGLAPMTGSLAPPPPYGSEAGSILLESGGADKQLGTTGTATTAAPGSAAAAGPAADAAADATGDGTRWAEWQDAVTGPRQRAGTGAGASARPRPQRQRQRHQQAGGAEGDSDSDVRIAVQPSGPARTSTDISLAPMSRLASEEHDNEQERQDVADDPGEGTSGATSAAAGSNAGVMPSLVDQSRSPPPRYSSPMRGPSLDRRQEGERDEQRSLDDRQSLPSIPSYDAVMRESMQQQREQQPDPEAQRLLSTEQSEPEEPRA
ncbi:Rsp5p-dependent ubiquitination, sorting of cargo proteins at the multivesicular body [Ascosphaera acerosa]|nr:Rsp5p-dependent ubiquitination, sorting of cargo proteins at the multivesicular body [Ascosphaera acerosa]